MKLGDVLKKERSGNGQRAVDALSAEDVASRIGLSTAEYEAIEAGNSPAERWGPVLAAIAIALETPASRLLAESGRFADTNPGQAGALIRGHREQRGLSASEVAEKTNVSLMGFDVEITEEEYEEIESGNSELEKCGPILLGFAEVIEQPVFNLIYPCGLPFAELDDYP